MATKRTLMALLLAAGFSAAAASVEYGFDGYGVGPIDGQAGWNVYNKVRDSNALSIMDGVGRSGEAGDKALVLRYSDVPLRGVSGDAVRWMPGETLQVAFDFRLGATSEHLVSNKPVLTLLLGNSLLAEKGRWEIRLEAVPDGSWNVAADWPGWPGDETLPAGALVERPASSGQAAVSPWLRMVLEVRKSEEIDRFETQVEIVGTDGNPLFSKQFKTMAGHGPQAAAMWSLPRLHAGFGVQANQHGLACIDNLAIKASK